MKGTVTFSEKYDTTMDPFVVGAVPLLTKKRSSPSDKRYNIVPCFRVYLVSKQDTSKSSVVRK